jgi:hypothetical protein
MTRGRESRGKAHRPLARTVHRDGRTFSKAVVEGPEQALLVLLAGGSVSTAVMKLSTRRRIPRTMLQPTDAPYWTFTYAVAPLLLGTRSCVLLATEAVFLTSVSGCFSCLLGSPRSSRCREARFRLRRTPRARTGATCSSKSRLCR